MRANLFGGEHTLEGILGMSHAQTQKRSEEEDDLRHDKNANASKLTIGLIAGCLRRGSRLEDVRHTPSEESNNENENKNKTQSVASHLTITDLYYRHHFFLFFHRVDDIQKHVVNSFHLSIDFFRS